jgi:hypothetical protein
MADVTIPENHWLLLKRSANCYVPRVVQIASNGAFNNQQLHEAGKKIGLQGFSVQLVGKIMRLEAVTHSKAEQCVKAYEALCEGRTDLPDPKGIIVVAALFGLTSLTDQMAAATMDVATLAGASSVSEGAIEHALDKGRVTGGIVTALQTALKVASLAQFCTSKPATSMGKPALPKDCPFTLNDLMVQLPSQNPAMWP